MKIGHGKDKIYQEEGTPDRCRPPHQAQAEDDERPSNIARIPGIALNARRNKSAIVCKRVIHEHHNDHTADVGEQAKVEQRPEFERNKQADDETADQPDHGNGENFVTTEEKLRVVEWLSTFVVSP